MIYKFTQGVQVSELAELMLLIKLDKTCAGEPGSMAQKRGKTLGKKNGIQGNVLALWIVKYVHIIFLLLCILLIKKMQCCNNHLKAWLTLKVPINTRSIRATEWGAWS